MKKIISLQSIALCLSLIFLYSCQYDDFSAGKGNGVTPDGEINVKVEVKIAIGGIVYENLDAHIRVTGYDANNVMQWVKDYDFIGPADTLAIKNSFDHYSLELVDKWGINDIQTDVTAKEIWDGRIGGSVPVTYVLGGSKEAKRLSSYVTSRQVSMESTGIIYEPESRVLYNYRTDGLLEYIHHQTFNPQTSQFEELSIDTFIYDGNRVSKIITSLNGQPYTEDHFEYGAENKITETLHFDNNLVWTQTSKRNDDSSSVSVNYSLSNGNSFSYAFNTLYKNIVNDETTQAGQTCNQGSYLYDKNVNPFRHLGYMDFYLLYWSINNKVAEQVDYLACGFPVLMPLFHYYSYDQDGYPTEKITKYKPGANQNTSYHTKINFFY